MARLCKQEYGNVHEGRLETVTRFGRCHPTAIRPRQTAESGLKADIAKRVEYVYRLQNTGSRTKICHKETREKSDRMRRSLRRIIGSGVLNMRYPFVAIDTLRRAVFVALLALAALAMPGIAEAHISQGNTGGFLSGFAHPLSGADHLLAMFCVGLWGAQMGGRAVWSLPVAFPLIMVVGGILGIAGVPLPAVESGIAVSIMVLGAAIAFVWRPPEWLALTIIGVFAICHGYAHGAELPAAADPADFAIGFVIATGLIHLAGIAAGLAFQRYRGGALSRALGGLIGLGGVYFLVA